MSAHETKRWHRHHKQGPKADRRMEKCVDEHMARAAANQDNSTFTCRIIVPGSRHEPITSRRWIVWPNLLSRQPKHVTERLESPTSHREIIVPCGTQQPATSLSSRIPHLRLRLILSMYHRRIFLSTHHQHLHSCNLEVLAAQPDHRAS